MARASYPAVFPSGAHRSGTASRVVSRGEWLEHGELKACAVLRRSAPRLRRPGCATRRRRRDAPACERARGWSATSIFEHRLQVPSLRFPSRVRRAGVEPDERRLSRLVATGPHPARLETRRPDRVGNRSEVEVPVPGDAGFHDVVLDVNFESFDAIQAS